MKFIALAAGGFFAGAKIRDIRWWFALSKEWPTTSELLDWPKIEALAILTVQRLVPFWIIQTSDSLTECKAPRSGLPFQSSH